MNAKTAVARRIQALCLERNIAINALANQCGVAPSTIYSMLILESFLSRRFVMAWRSAFVNFSMIRCLKILSRR